MSTKSDTEFMREAIAISLKCIKIGEAPFGAVIVKDNKIVARGADRVARKIDPTAHAEIIAIRQAASRLKTYVLSGCKIYTSTIPCKMCMEAIKAANIDEVYYACTEEDISTTAVMSRYQHTATIKMKMVSDIKTTNILRQEGVECVNVLERLED